MKSILMSIKPKWCDLIVSGAKTVEIRKTRPKLDLPFKVYIYESRRKGKVIGEFVCDRIDIIGKRGCFNNFDYCYLSLKEFGNDDIAIEIEAVKKSCVPRSELNSYAEKSLRLFALHISGLKIYNTPKELSEFKAYNTRVVLENGLPMPVHKISHPPQSWMYVENKEN